MFSGNLSWEFNNLKELEVLDIYNNGFNGSLPKNVTQMLKLKHLNFGGNYFNGKIPTSYGEMKELNFLSLAGNDLSGEIPSELGNLTSLEYLYLGYFNQFDGGIPIEFGKLINLVHLDLASCFLKGSIPNELGQLYKLDTLFLQKNQLTGSIPPELGNLSRLNALDLSLNNLTGGIPNEFSNLQELSLLNLFINKFHGEIPDFISELPKLQVLKLWRNNFTGVIPPKLGQNKRLTELDLSTNKLTGILPKSLCLGKRLKILILLNNFLFGSLPNDLGQCYTLQRVRIGQNYFTGPIPIQLAQIHILNHLNVSWNHLNQSLPKELSVLKGLTSADFSHNNFSGSIPEGGQFSTFKSTCFEGNPQLCGYESNPCKISSTNELDSQQKNSSRNGFRGKFKLVFALALLLCSLVFAIFAIMKSRKSRRSKSNSWKLTAFQKIEYGSEEIVGCIKESNVIGKGGAGVVYKGTMPNGDEIAVKKLLGINNGSSSHQDNGFSAEIKTLGRIRHRYIVRLVAFCSNKETNLLVYDYMENGSLGEVLHGKRGEFLKWDVRLKIGVEAAKGLCYLHHDCSPLIIHRDVKSNNILLNSEFEAHVADFGLAKFMQDNGNSECMSSIAGSYGYIAPEYAYTLKVDEKSDVYSFGVVLLELITGKRPVGDFEEEGLDIVQWTKMKTNWNKDMVIKILDERLPQIPIDEAKQVFFVAMLCVHEHSVERPTMREVVEMLAQAK
ncbi:leucine-rich repeat receptor-like serine threonine-protein kinase bam3-like protein [Trifolium pratense]|uniref:non-specific serine/threonine protein kinase n=1 Tax=Trifolium pratense TaxID=57577 RepID=A0A2K3PEP4_TRIPR|nr:leucine-rich repeat receptor-like serine threonine-protein kinase bam3-like protein [Trifolium pratense]